MIARMASGPLTTASDLLDDTSLDVSREIAPFDGMYAYGPDLYFPAGQTALRCVRLAMLGAKVEKVDSILDFACGAGRVLRFLRAGFPDAAITACDVIEPAVRFCEQTFGATGVVSKANPAEIELDGSFDVIWSGSLLTHVDSRLWLEFLEVMASRLAPGGVMLFTVYGRRMADWIRTGSSTLDLTEEQARDVLTQYDDTGFGFRAVEGRHEEGFGDCLASPAWVSSQLDRTTPDLDLVLYLEHAWLDQDVIAATKSPGA
jgi:SAM-dependent methyltransferase